MAVVKKYTRAHNSTAAEELILWPFFQDDATELVPDSFHKTTTITGHY